MGIKPPTSEHLRRAVLAGADGLDPRQMSPQVSCYTEAVGKGAVGLRIGVLAEGFGQSLAIAPVEEAVRLAVERLASADAEVTTVSAPMHREASTLVPALCRTC